jgi:hypothetical protein
MRRSAKDADDPTVPEWPNTHECPRCRQAVWSAISRDGSDVLLDTIPMETQLVVDDSGSSERVRAPGFFRLPSTRRISGWRLHDPSRIVTCEYIPDLPAGETWLWHASKIALTVDNMEALYSEHVYTCSAAPAKMVTAAMHALALTGDGAGDRRKKAAGACEEAQRRAAVRRLAKRASELDADAFRTPLQELARVG